MIKYTDDELSYCQQNYDSVDRDGGGEGRATDGQNSFRLYWFDEIFKKKFL